MKRNFKFITSFIMVFALVLTLLTPMSVNAQEFDMNMYVAEKAYGFMQVALSDAYLYELYNEGNEFSISENIPVYIQENGMLTKSDTLSIYFVIEHGKPIAELMLIGNEGDSVPCIQFSTGLANSFSSYEGDAFTVVVNDEKLCFVDNVETNNEFKYTTSFVVNNSVGTYATRAYPSSYMTSVPFKSMDTNGLCWAACVASVGQYKTGINKTAKQVCKEMGIEYGAGGNVYVIEHALSNIYNINAFVYRDILTTQLVANVLMSGGGIVAGCATATGNTGHAVVIAGYAANSTGCYYRIMDPNASTYTMMTSGKDSNGKDTYCFFYQNYGTFYWRESVYFY